MNGRCCAMKIKKIGIVSLSSGIMGESFIKHELKIGKERLRDTA